MASAPTPGASRADTKTGHAQGQDGSDGGDNDDEEGERDDAGDFQCSTPPTPWAPSTAQGAPCLVCDVVGSGLRPRLLPLHGVGAQRCGHLVLFQTKSRPRPRCGSPVPDMPRNKRGYLQAFPTRAPAALQGAAKKGVYAACVLVFVMHSCLCLCRLLQHPCRTEEDIERGMAGAAAAFTGTSSRNIQGSCRSSSKRAPGCLHLRVPLT